MSCEKSKKTICVDFDGVIHKYSRGWMDGTIYDSPVEHCLDALALLVKNGFKIVIHTSRLIEHGSKVYLIKIEQQKEILRWLEHFGFRKGTHYHNITSKKAPAIAYIDDRGLRFTNWNDMIRYFV